jgi:N-acetyl-D-muramate 6-phosphate phosphatase
MSVRGTARAALFDLDGTLLDTAPDMAAALNALRLEMSLEPLPFSVIRPQVSNGALAMIRLAFPAAAGEQFERLRVRFLDIYRAALAVHTRLFPGFEPVLQQLEACALPWGVVTNKAAWLTEPLLEALDLRRRAGCVLSGDTLPERKPHPRPLLVAAGQLGVAAADCVYVGDALRDVQAANGAGMCALGAQFGYLNPLDEPQHWPVAGWLATPADLLPWLDLQSARDAARPAHDTAIGAVPA